MLGRSAALHVAEDCDFTFSCQNLRQLACGDSSALTVVSGDVACNEAVAVCQAGVNNDDGLALVSNPFHGVPQCDGVEWCEHDGIILKSLIGDEIDLLAAIVFAWWADEGEIHSEFGGGFFRSCFDGLPINVSGSFGDDGNAELSGFLGFIATC